MARMKTREDTDGSEVPPRLRKLHLRTYPMRSMGMGLGMLPVLVVLYELDAGWPAWAWTLLCCLAWPHVALMRARSAPNPYRAELTNLMIDSAIAGSLVPLMQGDTSHWSNEALSQFGTANYMIKQNALKYQYYGEEMPEVLFDLEADPGETCNLIDDPAYAEAVTGFRARLAELGHGPNADLNYVNAGY